MATTSSFDLTSLARQVMLDRGFIPDFSPEEEQEAKSLHLQRIPFPEVPAQDLRHLLWFSIDNDDSRDLDQLTYAETLPDGRHQVYIAVADVAWMVKKDDPIDRRAAHNTTSVYTPSKVFPMLPERLSTDLTSLNPDQDRLALIFKGALSHEGQLEEYAIFTGYVHNYAKLAYDSVSLWLEGKASPPSPIQKTEGLESQIRLQDTIAQHYSEYRQSIGALSLETIEAAAVFSDGIPVSMKEIQKNRARLLIENFMILANAISARFTEANRIFSLRRVVDKPKRWDKIVAIAESKGTRLPPTPDGKALEQFLVDQKKSEPLTFPDLSLTIIKLLGRGVYQVYIPGKSSPGHFGLALPHYSQSTAPNRRFPDLIMQRLLLAFLAKQPLPYNPQELIILAERCTNKEDDAEKVQRRMKKTVAAIILTPKIGEEFDAIVTGASEKGTWARILTPPIEGKLVKGEEGLDVGDRLRVKLIHTDVSAGYIDFSRVN